MTIVEALKKDLMRISVGDRWLYWSFAGHWIVRTTKREHRGSIIILETENEHEAVEALIAEVTQ